MARNQDQVFAAFVSNKEAKCGNFRIERGQEVLTLYSYSTPLAVRREDGAVEVNQERYSVTTSCQRSALVGALTDAGLRATGETTEREICGRGTWGMATFSVFAAG